MLMKCCYNLSIQCSSCDDLLKHDDRIGKPVLIVLEISCRRVTYVQNQRRIAVTKLTRSGGAVVRPREYRKASRDLRIREYFYGPRSDLQPSFCTMPFASLRVYRVGGGFAAPRSALPIGELALCRCCPIHAIISSLVSSFTRCTVV